MRRPILTANWKMHKTRAQAAAFVTVLREQLGHTTEVDVVIAAPFTSLAAVHEGLVGSEIALAAQNVCAEAEGAFTGEISPAMLADAGCHYCIVGHSERRALYGEQDAEISRKAAALLGVGIRPIVCVGETLEEREADRTADIVASQLAGSLTDVETAAIGELVVAYEPVWAIGTGHTATPEQAQEVHLLIRARLRERFGASGADIRIQYGGSVKPENVVAIMAQPDIDGALVGGASLAPESFAKIVRYESQENRAT
ncbi:MAG: triose-phosphate isomerase [Deltaproteobacteria bacterium]|nr:triose-phosphate isomerase [Deltaproteobacteria bacterium]